MIVPAVLTTDELQWLDHWQGYVGRRWYPAQMRLERARSGYMPVLLDHVNGARIKVGTVIGDTVEVVGGELRAELYIDDDVLAADPANAPLLASLQAGLPQNLSVGVLAWSVSRIETDGNVVYEANDSEPVEVSLVGAGACAGARIVE